MYQHSCFYSRQYSDVGMSFDVVMNADTVMKIVIPAAVAVYGKRQLKLRVIVFSKFAASAY